MSDKDGNFVFSRLYMVQGSDVGERAWLNAGLKELQLFQNKLWPS